MLVLPNGNTDLDKQRKVQQQTQRLLHRILER
jgi:hypothetical protein